MDFYEQYEEDYYELREEVEEEKQIMGINERGEIVYE